MTVDQIDGEIRRMLSEIGDAAGVAPSFEQLRRGEIETSPRPRRRTPSLALITAVAITVTTGVVGIALFAQRDHDPASTLPPLTSAAGTDVDPISDVPEATESDLVWPSNIDPLDPSAERVAPAGFSDDLAYAIGVIGRRVGERCTSGSQDWMSTTNPAPELAPVAAQNADGDCVVGGWAYTHEAPLTLNFDFELPVDDNGYVLQPIFNEQGQLIAFFTGGE